MQRVQFTSGSTYLIAEFLDDDLVHFELAHGTSPGTGAALFTTPQVAKKDYTGPTSFNQSGNTLTTASMKVEVTAGTLCVKVSDPTRLLYEACPRNLSQAWKGLTITKGSIQNAYGLGEQFFMGGSADGDWVGRSRTPGGQYGNAMAYDTDNGPVGNAQIPILFAVGAANLNYGFFLDQVYKQEWNLTGDPWTVDTWGDQVRWYTMTGADLPDLRKDYMELTGRPPVPPKKAFGMWVSEFGYDNWAEIDNRLSGLRTAKFPVDGFVLDLPWFGGVTAGSDNTRMGSLSWDTAAFPNPSTKIASLSSDEGVGLMTIEESYIGKNRPEHADMASRGYLNRTGCSTCAPVYLTTNDWWGRGGMIDWTQDAAADHWHATKRKPLSDQGVMGHWLDLGEPEMYDAGDWTAGVLPGKHAHADYHNVYNLKWAESIARGYASGTKRPFMLARSGAGGIQRHGVAMWSADIGSKLTALAQQQNVQMHMSMSGIDYFGSDIGGFRREMLNSDLDELYTQWFADGAWFEVPIRPHTENLCNCAQTSPDKIGHTASNLANLRQRYELTPYYYSLAHRAHRFGEPVVPPLAYHYQNDLNVREMGHQKLVGKDLLVGVVGRCGRAQAEHVPARGHLVRLRHQREAHQRGTVVQRQAAVGERLLPAARLRQGRSDHPQDVRGRQDHERPGQADRRDHQERAGGQGLRRPRRLQLHPLRGRRRLHRVPGRRRPHHPAQPAAQRVHGHGHRRGLQRHLHRRAHRPRQRGRAGGGDAGLRRDAERLPAHPARDQGGLRRGGQRLVQRGRQPDRGQVGLPRGGHGQDVRLHARAGAGVGDLLVRERDDHRGSVRLRRGQRAPAGRLVGGQRGEAVADRLPDLDGDGRQAPAEHHGRVEVRQAEGGELPRHGRRVAAGIQQHAHHAGFRQRRHHHRILLSDSPLPPGYVQVGGAPPGLTRSSVYPARRELRC
ncbi:hypothetical protein GCM10020219_055080 [Nonomuraea dietziae]